jgi:hypothetical protein
MINGMIGDVIGDFYVAEPSLIACYMSRLHELAGKSSTAKRGKLNAPSGQHVNGFRK